MFTQVEGPTALRADLVQALAFSVGEARAETPEGAQQCVAALAAVWNARQGFVVVLLCSLDRPVVYRYAFMDPINSPDELSMAIEEGMGFASSLGFIMDAPEFRELEPEEQDSRMQSWNELRKPEKTQGGTSRGARARDRRPERRANMSPTVQPAPQEIDPLHEPDPGTSGSGRAVLGKIALIRQREGEKATDLASKLLGFF